MERRQMKMKSISALTAFLLLVGCASLNSIDSDVSSYSQWPAERKPGSYAFERLPSQQAYAERQAMLEAAARGALAAAGFNEVGSASNADVTVQLGARVTRYDGSPWYDPYWRGYYPWGWGGPYGWGGPWGYYGPGMRYGYGFGMYYAPPYYDREVAVLIRDRKSGAPLYESRASSEGGSSGDGATFAAMFEAALKDFPQPAVNPRRVSVPLPPTN
jgi:hypothetical protein